MQKWVYIFSKDKTDGASKMKPLLGGKGANLAEMSRIGLPIPPGFTITTEACTYYYQNKQKYPPHIRPQIEKALTYIQKNLKKKFGDIQKSPLLFSVRSGARVSMPGMMDTILNLGLNDKTVKSLAKQTNERFAYDSYRRFIQMYSNVVMRIDHDLFEAKIEQIKKQKKYSSDTNLTAQDWKKIIEQFKAIYQKETKQTFPQDVYKQLWNAIGAVFSSWMNKRAIIYRKINDIPDDWGTAVNVQSMVFGNLGNDSATGVCFTRDPATGKNIFYGEYLLNAQGEDVVAGIRTPQPLNKKEKQVTHSSLPSLEEEMPKIYKELDGYRKKLENHYKDMQDMEFTIENKKLWILQTRTGKRTTRAAIKMAVDMVKEKRIDQKTALLRIPANQLDQLLHPMIDPKAKKIVIAKGLPASPGSASGKLVFSAEQAEKLSQKGEKVILARIETSPEDIGGMNAAEGIVTSRGGMTSHAAVVTRGMGKPCIAGAADIKIDYKLKTLKTPSATLKEGDVLTLDGTNGEVIKGDVPKIKPALTGDFGKIMRWADTYRRLEIRANAETPTDAAQAFSFGAQGIGLCRTEHMFFDPKRIIHIQEMIVARDEKARKKALAKLLPSQRKDFIDLFKIMKGLPVTIRLLDPPLHEFLPHEGKEQTNLAKLLKISATELKTRTDELREMNPMLGLRGCRLGILYPEIYQMQTQAIFEAMLSIHQRTKKMSRVEIMIPLVLSKKELLLLKEEIKEIANQIQKKTKSSLRYHIGTMIELPRAALCADDIATEADFFSFGTNDLTQTTLGLSRDDAGTILNIYKDKGIFAHDPFAVLDQKGVGELIKIAVEKSRKVKPDIQLGICGEHGGEPQSVAFCHERKLDYVSCSPYRIPVARLAAAQIAIQMHAKKEIKKK